VHADQWSTVFGRRHGKLLDGHARSRHDPAHEQQGSAVQFPSGFHLARLYPVEGDSAIAELWHGDDVWADLRLDGIRLDEHGEQRVAGVRCVLRLYPPPDGADPAWWEWDLDAVLAQLTAARAWLLDNERGRAPIDDPDGLTAAGAALSKAALEEIERLSARDDSSSSPPAAPVLGTGHLAVVLQAPGPRPILLIRCLREITGFGLRDARALLDTVPATVATGLSDADAARIGRLLESAGATVEIRA
jgi:large subunit ribosomal protein L7/L12